MDGWLGRRGGRWLHEWMGGWGKGSGGVNGWGRWVGVAGWRAGRCTSGWASG